MENISIISIEGNIGSGKSTLLKKIQDWAQENYYSHIYFALEPVDDWIKTIDSDGKNILDKFYNNQEKWSFPFQMNSFISRVKCVHDAFASSNENDKLNYLDGDNLNNVMEKLVFVERSIYTDRNCFAKLLYENGKMTELEYNIYCKWNEWLSDEFNMKPDGYIYLRCLPEINEERIKERNRDEESSIPLDYLKQLHNKHDEWMLNATEDVPVLIINALENFREEEKMKDIFREIYEFIKEL